jgi:hypothetical protein
MSETADDLALVLYLNQELIKFTYYINLIMCPTGLALNFISILVFNRKAFKKNTMGFYYTAISIIDIFLIVAAFINYYSVTTNQDVSLISNFSCVLMTYSNRITLQMSSWANVLITFDRLLCVTYRNKFAFMKKKKNLFLGFILLKRKFFH